MEDGSKSALLQYLQEHPETSVSFTCVPEQGKLIGLVQYYIDSWVTNENVLTGNGPGATMSILLDNLGDFRYEQNDCFSVAYQGAYSYLDQENTLVWFFFFQPGFHVGE